MSENSLSKLEISAMWFFRDAYEHSNLSAFEFYRSLSDQEKKLVNQMVNELAGAASYSCVDQERAQMERDCAAMCESCKSGMKPVLHKFRLHETLGHCTSPDMGLWSKCTAAPIRLQWASKVRP